MENDQVDRALHLASRFGIRYELEKTIVEKNEKVRDALRAEFKKLGFRVLITHNPAMACQRYKEQPYHSVIMDAVTAGEEGIDSFKEILSESDNLGLTCAAILIIDRDQSDLAEKVPQHKAAVGRYFDRPMK